MTGVRTRALIAAGIGIAVAVGTFAALATGGDRNGRPTAARPAAAEPHEGRAVFASMGCGGCHQLAAAGSTGRIGPDLDKALEGHDRESLVHSIVRMPRLGPSVMPDDYGSRMTDAELDRLVSFLLATSR